MALVPVSPELPDDQIVPHDDVAIEAPKERIEAAVKSGWHCLTGPKSCPECAYTVNSHRWSKRLRSVHDPNVSPVACVRSRNRFVMGCHICRSAGIRKEPLAEFRVETVSCMQMSYWWRHLKTAKHRQACNSLNIDLLTDLIPGEAKELVKKPPVSLMLWGLRLTFSSSAYLEYSKFVECGDITLKNHQDTLMSGRWSHKSMAKKVECRRGFGGYVGRET